MMPSFGREYAAAYDSLYADKDYDAECITLDEIFRRSRRKVRTVLDLGCGTGSHAVRLAALGYQVVGVDMSEEMLDVARRRPGSRAVTYISGDIRSLKLNRSFDAVICMFAVLGYQTADRDVEKAMATVARHLLEGGDFVFDVWNGPVVEAVGPSERTKVVSGDATQISRHASALVDPAAHICNVTYHLVTRGPNSRESVTDEVHQMRYFFVDELAHFLSRAGLRLTEVTALPDPRLPISQSWNILAMASREGAQR